MAAKRNNVAPASPESSLERALYMVTSKWSVSFNPASSRAGLTPAEQMERQWMSLPHFAVDMALSAVSDRSAPFFASTATWSPAAKSLEAILNPVTGVLGGTVTF